MAPLDHDNTLGIDDHSETFLSQGNVTYLSEMHVKFLADRNSVNADWQAFFKDFQDADLDSLKTEIEGPSWGRKRAKVVGATEETSVVVDGRNKGQGAVLANALDIRQATSDSIGALQLIRLVFNVERKHKEGSRTGEKLYYLTLHKPFQLLSKTKKKKLTE